MTQQSPPAAPQQGDPQHAGSPYQPPAGYTLTKAKRKRWPWLLGGVAALIVIIAVAGGSGGNTDTSPAAPDAPAVPASSGTTYEVTTEGGGTALVTYTSDGSFNISQENGAALPWTKTVDLGSGILGGGAGASLQAQGDGSADSITCRVTHDGEVVSENTSTGQFAVVTCSGF